MIKTKPYLHRIQYYETDKMGITNNTNYVRFMEEARNDYFAQIHYPYSGIEKKGIISPVAKVICEYKRPTTYPDILRIKVRVIKLDRVKLTLGYSMFVDKKLVCKGYSEHCFLDQKHHLVNVKKRLPKLYRLLTTD